MGLIEGLRRYDPSTGFKEITFLWPTVYGTIQKEITTHNHTLKVGNRFKSYASRIHAAADKPNAPTNEQWAKTMGVSVAEVKLMRDYLATGYDSLEYEIQADGGTYTLSDIIGAPDDAFETVDIRDRIDRACVSDLDRAIIRLREKGFNNTEIAAMVAEVPNNRWKRSKNMKQISETLRRVRKRMRKGEQA